MSHQVLKLDECLLNVLKKDLSKRFTVLSLRAEYLSEPDLHGSIDPIELRRYLYKQILRLKKRDLVKAVPGKSRRQTQYVLSDAFQQVTIKASASPFAQSSAPLSDTNSATQMVPPHVASDLIESLREQTKQCQVEFMVTVGEAEEYQRVIKAYPSLKPALEPIYVQTRERSSRLLGQVRALERVLSIYCG